MTYLCPSPDGIYVAVGYEDGAVRIFSLLNGESNVSFNGHKSAVTVIRYDSLGSRLVTGSRVRTELCCHRNGKVPRDVHCPDVMVKLRRLHLKYG